MNKSSKRTFKKQKKRENEKFKFFIKNWYHIKQNILVENKDLSRSIRSECIKRNKSVKIKNGNISNQIRIITWNKGGCEFKAAINEIQDMINEKT